MKLPETLDEAIERIFDLEIENAKLKGMLEERRAPKQQVSRSTPEVTYIEETPAPESEPDDQGHIPHTSKGKRSAEVRKRWTAQGRPVPAPGSDLILVTTCDMVDCVAPEHHEVMSKAEARQFNSSRVVKEAQESLGQEDAFDTLMAQAVGISDGHMVTKDGTRFIHLPSGRNIGAARFSVWAMAQTDEIPQTVTRTCSYDGCIAATHLKVTSA